MVRKLETGGCSINGDGSRRRQRLRREMEVIDLTGDDEDFYTPPPIRRHLNPPTPPVHYEELSLAQPGTHPGAVRRAPPPSPPPPPVPAPVQEYIPEAPAAPHNDVVVCPQCGFLFIAFLYTAAASMLNIPDPVEPLNFDWLDDLELGEP
ncbi:hypothetical protein ZOSMA_186G00320 [Zostera marina]|uniref:LITAF domain-containing protein n=1 Tax=Zostera marina TaxID=29655 RepID=A0A0K9PSJ3_ZOSMR|nr:hypothetical protein ZOSMA_186G00320 [Zostera marina]